MWLVNDSIKAIITALYRISGRRIWVKLWRKWMPIDEIDFAVLCWTTVIDEFELQLTKTGDKSRNWMTIDQPIKDGIETSIRTFQSVRDEIESTFFKSWMKRWRKWAGKPIIFICYNLYIHIQIVPKKITIGIWVSIAKEPFMESEKSNQIMKLWLFFYNSVKTPSDLAK